MLHTKPACSSAVGNDGIIIDPPQSKSTVINAFPCVFHADSSEIKPPVAGGDSLQIRKLQLKGLRFSFIYVCVCCPLVSQKQL